MSNQKRFYRQSLVFGKPQECLPPGTYRAKFLGIEVLPPHPKYGAGFKLWWEVVDGVCKGAEASRLVNAERKPSKANALGKLLIGMLGHEPEPDEVIDPQAMVGQVYEIEVELQENELFSRVESVSQL